MSTVCYVRAADFARCFEETDLVRDEQTVWAGPDRRSGPADRRSCQHERRWQADRGRRYRQADRRQRGPGAGSNTQKH
jgi:hypothetical protein